MENQFETPPQPLQGCKVTIILPAYNEEESIGPIVSDLKQHFPDFEILLVDDGSTDNTKTIAADNGAKVFSHPYNIGNGAAIKTGLRNASGEWVIMMDADGQHNIADIKRLLEYKNSYDMVVGARTNASQTSRHRNVANFFFNKLASYVCKFRIEDLTSGFRLLRKETARNFIYLLPNTFSYPTTLTLAYLRCGRSINYVPIETKARKGKSKIKPIRDGVRFLLIITKIATLFSPLRVFLPVSFFFFLTGSCYYAYTFTTGHRFTNMSALLLSTAIIIFMMGLVSEQICHIRYDQTD